MPSYTPELLRDAISRAGLLAPDLSPSGRREAILGIAARYQCSEDTVRRQLTRLQQGAPPRKARADKGTSRGLREDVQTSLYAMLSQRRYENYSTKQLLDILVAQHPDASLAYSTIRDAKARYVEQLPKAVSTPRRIEIAGANTRWEMDLSVGDLFIADPRLNEGFPFRPQLIVCIDACTRCFMYAGYGTNGRAIDVGAVLHQAILPQSDIWPQCGVPREIGCDWGKVFVGQYFPQACAALGIETNPGHPYYPQDKGKCERSIGTIHHSFENTLVGWCTSNNKGENAIDPRKDFRLVGSRWIDPRFDQRLMTLPELNALLHDWIAGTYHREKHSTLGCSPNDQWLVEMRGQQIKIPDRKYLDMQFLPWEWRKVRRGQIRMHGIMFQSPALGQVEDCNVMVRYIPDDISKVHVYYDNIEVCQATPAPTYIVNQEGMDWATWDRTRKANRDQQALRRRVISELQNADIGLLETADIIHANAVDADPMFVQPPVERKYDALTAGMSESQIEDLQDLQVYGMPVIPLHPTAPQEPEEDLEEIAIRKFALA